MYRSSSPSPATEPVRARATLAIGLLALSSTAAVAVGELSRLRRQPQIGRGAQPSPGTGIAPVITHLELTHTQRALLGILGSFAASLAGVRGLTHVIHRRGSLGPLRDLTVCRRHIHHFVPGIVVAFAAGAAAILSPQPRSPSRMAIPFGVGLALTLDESALLLDLDDVYWSEEGRISVQIALGVLGGLSTLTLALQRVSARTRVRQAEPLRPPVSYTP